MKTNEFTTRHIGLAAFVLYVLGHESLIGVTKTDARSCAFTFSDPENRGRELDEAFFSVEGAAIGHAYQFAECLREIRQQGADASREAALRGRR